MIWIGEERQGRWEYTSGRQVGCWEEASTCWQYKHETVVVRIKKS